MGLYRETANSRDEAVVNNIHGMCEEGHSLASWKSAFAAANLISAVYYEDSGQI